MHPDFASQILGNNRTLAVYIPRGYQRDTNRSYPVFYLHDGQNLFDARAAAFGVAWDAAQAADRLISQGRIRPLIIVGIYNTEDRLNEFTIHRDDSRAQGGRGRLYASFVLDEVKPFVDTHYRTLADREHTAVGGSSMGGLISLTMAREHSDRFSMCGILSPSLWWGDGQVLKELEQDHSWMQKMRFWLDMGTSEGSQRGSVQNIANLRRLHEVFRMAGLRRGRHYSYWEVAGGEHNEASWAARFPGVLEFFFGEPANRSKSRRGKVPSLRQAVPPSHRARSRPETGEKK